MQTTDRDRDRKSLQDLAQMAKGMTPAPNSVASFGPVPSSRSVTSLPNDKKDDSGIVDLAAASAADPHAAMRAQTTPLANQSLFEDANPQGGISHLDAPASYIPPPPPVNAPPQSGHHAVHAYQQPAPSVPPPSVGSVPPPPAHYASVHPIGPSLTANKKKSGAGALVFVFGSVLALGAAAAGGFLYIKNHKPADPVAVTTKAPEPTPAVAVETPKTTEPAKVAENTAAPAAPSDGATDLNALPTVANKAPKAGEPALAKAVRSTKSTSAKEPAEAKAPAEDPQEAAKAKANLDKALAGNSTPAAPAAPAGPAGDLGSAMSSAAGGGKMSDAQPKAAPMQPAAGGNLPQKPSQGAVTGALGAVLPAARECLGPDDPISKASVVFNPDGTVYTVTVSGSAAGKPAATCIEKELKKARLQPFADTSYTANVTVRHN